MGRLEKIKVGQIVTAVGLKGEVKVYPYTDYKERFEELDEVYVEDKPVKIKGVRYQKNMAILKLEGTDDRNGAEALKDKTLYIDEKDLRELEEDEFFIFDLIGLKAVGEDGAEIGTVKDVIDNPAHSIFEIEKPDGSTFLLPYVSEFVINIDTNSGIMVIKLIEGLI